MSGEETSPQADAPAWHAMSKEDAIKNLECNDDVTSVGLTDAEAAARLEKYGPNKMTESEKKGLLARIWDQIANVLVLILVIVALVSMVRAIIEDGVENKVSNWIQCAIIFSVISINTWIGIIQEGNAEKAAEALKSMLSSDARALRNGK